MNKHTPGPWVNHGLAISSKAEWIAGNRTELEIATIHCEHNPVSAEGQFDYPEPECADANARLIALAPEMLEALSDLVYASDLAPDNDRGLSAAQRRACAVLVKLTQP